MLATIARFCVRRRRWVLAAWMLLFIAGITIGMTVFGRLHDSHGGASTESLVMRSRSGTVRRIHARHDRSKLRALYARYG